MMEKEIPKKLPKIIIPSVHELDEPIIKIIKKVIHHEPLITKINEPKHTKFKKDDTEITIHDSLPKHMEHILTKVMGWHKVTIDENTNKK